MRKLATIRKISEINPIKGKDRVEMATVDGWTCMVSKADNFKPGDLCIFCEPDSVFPEMEQWEFLRKYNFRIKTQRFKGDDGYVYSQGLVLPISILDKKPDLGDDVTRQLGITQYEPTMDKEQAAEPKRKYPKWLMRRAWFRKLVLPKKTKAGWPGYVSKTDEERIQNIPEIVNKSDSWVATEKVDGQSGTYLLVKKKRLFGSKYEFHVCSRNMELPRNDGSTYWLNAEKYDIKEKLVTLTRNWKCDWVAIQGECVAPKVQGNKYKVTEPDLYVFNLVFPFGRIGSLDARDIITSMGMKFVPLVGEFNLKGKSVNEILALANGKSKLADTPREGLVFRSENGLSFKAVSPEFLVKYGE